MTLTVLMAIVLMTGAVLGIFASERQQKVHQLELRRIRELEEAKKPQRVGGFRR